MNKREAIAYAQVTLDYMQSSKYKGVLTPETLGIEMKQCFKLYTHNVILSIAESQIKSAKKLNLIRTGSDGNV